MLGLVRVQMFCFSMKSTGSCFSVCLLGKYGDDYWQAAESLCASGLPYVRQRIFPDKPARDQHTYECPRCADEITEIVEFVKAEAFC